MEPDARLEEADGVVRVEHARVLAPYVVLWCEAHRYVPWMQVHSSRGADVQQDVSQQSFSLEGGRLAVDSHQGDDVTVLLDGARAELLVVCEGLQLQSEPVLTTVQKERWFVEIPVADDGIDRLR